MSQPFPKDRAGKLQALQEMNASAPELMAAINTLRDQFPAARITYFQAGDIEYGEPMPQGVVPNVSTRSQPPTPERQEAQRKFKRATAARKRK